MDLSNLPNWVPAAVVAFAVIVGWRVFRMLQQRSQGQSWDAVASRLGLTLDKVDGQLALSGTYRGHPLHAGTRSEVFRTAGSDKRTKHWFTKVSVEMKTPAAGAIKIQRPGTKLTDKHRSDARKHESMRNMVDIGDEKMDQNFVVLSETPQFAQKLLGGGSMLLHDMEPIMARDGGLLMIEGRAVTFDVERIYTDEAKFQKLLDVLTDFAEAVDKAK